MQPQQIALVSFPRKKIELDLALIESLIERNYLEVHIASTTAEMFINFRDIYVTPEITEQVSLLCEAVGVASLLINERTTAIYSNLTERKEREALNLAYTDPVRFFEKYYLPYSDEIFKVLTKYRELAPEDDLRLILSTNIRFENCQTSIQNLHIDTLEVICGREEMAFVNSYIPNLQIKQGDSCLNHTHLTGKSLLRKIFFYVIRSDVHVIMLGGGTKDNTCFFLENSRLQLDEKYGPSLTSADKMLTATYQLRHRLAFASQVLCPNFIQNTYNRRTIFPNTNTTSTSQFFTAQSTIPLTPLHPTVNPCYSLPLEGVFKDKALPVPIIRRQTDSINPTSECTFKNTYFEYNQDEKDLLDELNLVEAYKGGVNLTVLESSVKDKQKLLDLKGQIINGYHITSVDILSEGAGPFKKPGSDPARKEVVNVNGGSLEHSKLVCTDTLNNIAVHLEAEELIDTSNEVLDFKSMFFKEGSHPDVVEFINKVESITDCNIDCLYFTCMYRWLAVVSKEGLESLLLSVKETASPPAQDILNILNLKSFSYSTLLPK